MKKLLAAAVVLAATFVTGAHAADFPLTKVAETSTTITFTYPQQPGYGYLYSANGVLVSRTYNPAQTQIRFAKNDANSYDVDAITKGNHGHCCAPPPPKPACSDGIDNDNPPDGKVDYPADPGCSSATDTDETDPPPGPATMTPTQFRTACATGPVTSVEVTGNVTLPANCRATNVTFDGYFGLADGAVITGCAAQGFDGTTGASNWTLDSCVFDGRGQIANNPIYDSAGKIPHGWRILNSTFQNYYSQNTSTHSEALYVGYSDGGEIRGNHFINNGTTSDIFFTWWGDNPNPSTTYARNICVAGNTFRNDPGYPDHYYDVNFRAEIPTSAHIVVQRDASSTSPQFYGDC